ncbi:hypothetical protein [Halorhabdus sp. CUG00001]|uniref:hypothetical protein n=1 Tax=Halorhabdus sp. CUG00001 TaxID=2600297 RepID=UPI00131DF7C4|nr:hypothetical protein [Halorhabdus sp. CUG00001]
MGEKSIFDNFRRRTFLGLIAAAGTTFVSGCVSFSGNGTAAWDIIVHCEGENDKKSIVTVTRPSADETVVETTVTLSPGESHQINNEVRANRDYEVTIDVSNGPSETYKWSKPDNALHVIVDDSDNNVVFAKQVG